MSARYMLTVLLVLAAVGGLARLGGGEADAARPEDAEAPARLDDAGVLAPGKIAVVYELHGEMETHWALREAVLETIGGKRFVRGKVVSLGEGDEYWERDLVVRISLESVNTLLEFDSVEQYRERMNQEQEMRREI